MKSGHADEFERLRPLLFSIAYRMLGSVSDAEDVVQEAWLRYESSPAPPPSPRAYLTTIVTRIAIDVLRSARARRERYVGLWFPEPLLDDPYQEPERAAVLADSLSMAALLLLERLNPVERAVFVLREVFGFPFSDISVAVGKSEAACRQQAVRARRHMAAHRPRFEADPRKRAELAGRFFAAFADGDFDGLRDLLADDVQLVRDSGGRAPQWGDGVRGSENVARLLATLSRPFARTGGVVVQRQVNGQPGAVFRSREGTVINTWSLEVCDQRVQVIRTVLNPEKLRHIGEVADAAAVLRDTLRARGR